MTAVLLIFWAAGASAGVHEMAPEQIAASLKTLHRSTPGHLERLVKVSELFLGMPYRLDALGEGPDGEFDRDPIVSFKEGDCTTYVEQVMALALEPELAQAIKRLQRIRYDGGKVRYQNRRHFPEVDWIPTLIRDGYLRDVTREVAGEKAKTIKKRIDKKAWYLSKSTSDLQGFAASSDAEKAKRLARWRKAGDAYAAEEGSLDYLPLDSWPELLPKIPAGAILNVVREAREDKPVVVTHQLFVVDTPAGRRLRHAATGAQVMDVDPLAYFYKYFNSTWRVVGVNVVLPKAP